MAFNLPKALFISPFPHSYAHKKQTNFVCPSTLTHTTCARQRRHANITTGNVFILMSTSSDSYTTVLIIPTGIGASIGGYAGDALPCARLLSTVTDTLITHPNVLNGALMYWPIPNALYVEGFALDQFCAGSFHLQPMLKKSNKIGLLLDAGMSETARLRHLQAADAARATLGLQIVSHVVTEQAVGVKYSNSNSNSNDHSKEGASWGTIENTQTLLQGARKLIQQDGCEAIAVITEFPDEDEDEEELMEYRSGNGVDKIAGTEAVISHLITREFEIPCAHAPSLRPLDVDKDVSPKAAAEELGYTFLSCVLVGLSKAPKLKSSKEDDGILDNDRTMICSRDIDAVVVPRVAFGCAGVMALGERDDVLIISVEENETVMNVRGESVGFDGNRIVHAKSYAEAAGIIAAHRAGIEVSCVCSGKRECGRDRIGRGESGLSKRYLQEAGV